MKVQYVIIDNAVCRQKRRPVVCEVFDSGIYPVKAPSVITELRNFSDHGSEPKTRF